METITTTQTVMLPTNGTTVVSASAIRAHLRETGLKGKELTNEVNRRLAAFQPTGNAMWGVAMQKGYTVETVKCTKTGKIQFTVAPPKAADAEVKLTEAQAEIERLKALLVSKGVNPAAPAAPALVNVPAFA